MTTPTTPDPMRGADLPSALPVVPPPAMRSPLPSEHLATDLGNTPAARHAVNVNAEPLPGDEVLTVAMVSEHVVDVDERQSLLKQHVDGARAAVDSVRVAVGLAILLGVVAVAVSIYLIVALHDQGQRIDQQGVQSAASDTERARVDNLHRNAICGLAVALRGTASTPTRNAWVQGTAGYDRFYAAISTSAQDLQCDAR